MFKKLLVIIYLLLSKDLISKPINFEGLNKISLTDIQSITSIDIYNNDSVIDDVNIILKELSLSDLIFEINYEENEDNFLISISESDLVENIYVNNNIRIKDDMILQNLVSKENFFLTKSKIQSDLDIIKNIYKTKGFQDINIVAKVERFSKDRINLIYDIQESQQQKINIIKFIGNDFYSNSYLNSIIKSQSIKFYNILKSGSNLNYYIFDFDKNKILSSYIDDGFFDTKVSYAIEKTSFNNNILYFYIDEGDRYILNDVKYEFEDNFIDISINDLIIDFEEKIKKNNFYFSKSLIEEYVKLFNSNLISNNIFNKTIKYNFEKNNNRIDTYFFIEKKEPVTINKIEISGNSITKNQTIRSKISIEPGDYFNKYSLDKSINILKMYPYINDVKTDFEINNNLADIFIEIDEDLKTGNVLLAGTYNEDTGAGLTLGIEDKNIFGTGNSLSSNFVINSENLIFDVNYKQYPIMNPNLINNYSIFNQENDYTNSFGYKASRNGLGYFVDFKKNENINYGAGITYESFKGHSAVNTTSNAISDNIGRFENYSLNFSLKYDDTDDFYNPTNGTINRLDFTLSPNGLSDNSFYKFFITNKNYRLISKTRNFVFLNNQYGFAKSLNSKLKTMNAFGLGGLNFKGFDYQGIGPYDGSIYLGGNEFFTSTVGYGGSFIFDEKDNINIKIFLTTGSIWNSDYISSSDIKLRTSIGTSFDILTPIGPISFSYAVPIEKSDSDKTRPFNFSIGTSF